MRLTTLISSAVLLICLGSCSGLSSTEARFVKTTDSVASEDAALLWSSTFRRSVWQRRWMLEDRGMWGLENVQIVEMPEDRFERSLRVHYPASSASPAVARRDSVPIGGAEFRGRLGLPPYDRLRLSYHVRFSENFDFVKGGKLPGLYGGTANSGGDTPDGTDGFSARLMWRENGKGEVYAYLPTSENYGTSIGQGAWRFQPGRWHHVVQEIHLNQTGKANGKIQVWFDDELVVDRSDITFRSTDQLKIDGIFFSTFFGGGDLSWATPEAVYTDFAEFKISEVPGSAP